MEATFYTGRGQVAAPTHMFCWQRDWMQISRRRRSRGRGGPFLVCSVSAAGRISHDGHHRPLQGQVSRWAVPSLLSHATPRPHPRGEWRQVHRSQPLVPCTGHWSGLSLGPGGRLPRHQATEHRRGHPGSSPCSAQSVEPHSPSSRPGAHAVPAAPPAHPCAGDSETRPPHVMPEGRGPRWQPAVPKQPLGPGHCHSPGQLGHGRGCLRLVW